MKVIKISEEKFKMVDGSNEVEFGLLIKKDGSVNDSLLLPENSLGRKWLNLNKLKDCNEVELREIQRSPSENHKKNWAEYMTEAEKETLENIKKNCEKRMEDEKKKVEDPKYKQMLNIKKSFKSLIDSGYVSEESEEYKKICELIANYKVEG